MTREELLMSKEYWITHVRLELYNLLKNTYDLDLMPNENAAKLGVSGKNYRELMHGDFNGNLDTLFDVAIKLGKYPVITFKTAEEILKDDERQNC